jgi:hypothetical protein
VIDVPLDIRNMVDIELYIATAGREDRRNVLKTLQSLDRYLPLFKCKCLLGMEVRNLMFLF